MVFPVPPRREPHPGRSPSAGRVGAGIGAFFGFLSLCLSLVSSGMGPGGDDDVDAGAFLGALVCCSGFWIGGCGLLGYLVGRWLGRDPRPDELTQGGIT